MQIETFWVGSLECRLLVHRQGRARPEWMFPHVPPGVLQRRIDSYLDAAGTFEFVYSSLLVRSGSAVALLDSGPPPEGAELRSDIQRSLDGLGVAPSEVATVVISHGHLDHIGGLVTSRGPAFSHARHIVDSEEVRYWTTGDRAGGDEASVFRTVSDAGLIEVVSEEREVLPGIRVLQTPGHTPGHLAVALTSAGESALYVGDVLAHEINVPEPDWSHFSDMLPHLAAGSRRRVVERAVRERSLIIGSHVASRGRAVRSAAGGYAFVVHDTQRRIPAS